MAALRVMNDTPVDTDVIPGGTTIALIATTSTTASAVVTTPAILATPTPATSSAIPVSEDRRALRTKRLLRFAFTELIAECGLDGFSVGDLTSRADINRGTFYAHYRDMADLLSSFEEEMIVSLEALKPRIKAVTLKELLHFINKGTPPQVTIDLFDLLREHGPFLLALLNPQGDASFQARLREQICSQFVLSVLHEKYTKDPKPLTEYYVAYYASALLGLIQHWLERGMVEGSEEMARIMLSIMFLKPGDSIVLKGPKQ